jgi:hypothetical protein
VPFVCRTDARKATSEAEPGPVGIRWLGGGRAFVRGQGAFLHGGTQAGGSVSGLSVTGSVPSGKGGRTAPVQRAGRCLKALSPGGHQGAVRNSPSEPIGQFPSAHWRKNQPGRALASEKALVAWSPLNRRSCPLALARLGEWQVYIYLPLLGSQARVAGPFFHFLHPRWKNDFAS